jgi:hypothetical protein
MGAAQHGNTVQLLAACGMLAVTLAGCGHGGPPRALVSGTVTYRGSAIPEGAISFIPTDGTTGPTMTVAIVDGTYKMDKFGGVPTGAYQVRIVAARGRPTDGKQADTGFRLVQYIPAKYNTKSDLKITVDAGGGSMTRDFALTN